jgi:hypothetical protein
MPINVDVPEGKTLTITGPAKAIITVDPGREDLVKLDDGNGGEPEPPEEPASLTSLSPNTAVAGDADDITMIVNGSGFSADSVIVFNGHDEPTTLISPTKVSTGVKPSLFVVPAECPVIVRNGDMDSNALTFSFTE